jgi:hypothetical protein
LILLFGQSEEDEVDALLFLTDKLLLLGIVSLYSYISGLYGYINKVEPKISRQLFKHKQDYSVTSVKDVKVCF